VISAVWAGQIHSPVGILPHMNKPKLSYPCIPQFANLVELKDYRPTTKKEYVRYLVKLAEHFQCDPSTLGEDQLREYFPSCASTRTMAAAPCRWLVPVCVVSFATV
jgi:hypothetical protein